MASKADQKNEARQKREAAQAAAAAAAKRNRNLQVLGGVIFSALVVVVLVVLLGSSGSKKGPTGLGEGSEGQVAGVAETKTLLTGIEQNGFALGKKDAPVTIIEFLDVQCPFCKTHQLDEQPTVIKELVRTGKAKLRAAPIALPQMGEDSEAGRIVAARLADKDKAWDFLNLFYFNQGDEATGYVTNDYLTKLVGAIPGTTSADADRASTPEVDAKLKDIDELQTALNVSGTPSFAIGKTGDDYSTYQLLTLNGGGSVADQIISAVNDLSKRSGV
ncbi:MAG: thioredoxin domain-containing protein [Solirubrobacteraceae bacterium]|nr:thioredoxin domain-containing protein [Solirubrobacteraceae bacterium]